MGRLEFTETADFSGSGDRSNGQLPKDENVRNKGGANTVIARIARDEATERRLWREFHQLRKQGLALGCFQRIFP